MNMTWKLKFDLEKSESIAGKGENAGYQYFLLFPQCFQKLSFSGALKVGIVWWSVNAWTRPNMYGNLSYFWSIYIQEDGVTNEKKKEDKEDKSDVAQLFKIAKQLGMWKFHNFIYSDILDAFSQEGSILYLNVV